MRTIFGVLVLCIPISAQRLNHPTPGIPRTADGKPNLTAPAPRAADGRPDLSGLWGMNPGAYTGNIAVDLKPEDIQPWADALFKKHAGDLSRDDPAQAECLPEGPRANLFAPQMEKFVQTPSLIVILIEDLTYRQIFLDGRELPEDPNPSFMGYSVGHWERADRAGRAQDGNGTAAGSVVRDSLEDTLVVQSTGYNDRTWLDLAGHPHTEALRITERFRRRDFGHMEIVETLDDPKAFKKPFTIAIQAEIVPDTEILEYVCAENEKDHRHLVGKASDERPVPVKVAPEILSKYVGTYDFSYPETPTVMIRYTVTMSGGELFMDTEGKGRTPLIPLSETVFSMGPAGRMEFIKDDRGVVTYFVTLNAEGDLKHIRRPDSK